MGHFSGVVDLTSSVENFEKSFNGMDGTVWDMIPGVKETMYQHQQDGFEFLWKNLEGTLNLAELKSLNSSNIGGGCIISHAPGTGKTRLTIVFIVTYLKLFPDARPVIIAPASMLLTWEEEFMKWKVQFPFHNLNSLDLSGKEHILLGKSREKFVRLVKLYSWNQETSILGISYQLFERLAGERHRRRKGNKKGEVKVVDQESENIRKILLQQPRLVVLDEGHTPRSQNSCIWNTLLKLKAERRIILSGTPFQNNFRELFNTFHLVRPTIASSLAKEKAFAEIIPSGGREFQRNRVRERGISFTSSSAEQAEKLIETLKERMAPFVHIHKGSILQKNLPGLRDCVILLTPPPLQKSLIKKIEPNQSIFQYDHKVALLSVHPSLFQNCLLSEEENSNLDLEMLTRLRRDPNAGVKTRFIMELIRHSKALNEKVIIFSQYIQPLRLIKDQVMEHFNWKEGKQIFEMQGRLEQKLRQSMIQIFNNPLSEAQILLASTKCCSEGINLVGASRIVLLDVVWNPSVERQAISRAYRLGQKKVVFTYHLMTSGTTEDEKYCRQAEKDRFSELVFSSTTKEEDKQKKPSPVFKDSILKEMVDNANFMDMFEKIIYQPKEVNLINTFVSSALP